MKHLHYRFVNGARPGYAYGNPNEAESYFKAHGVCYSREDDDLNTYFTIWGANRRRRPSLTVQSRFSEERTPQ